MESESESESKSERERERCRQRGREVEGGRGREEREREEGSKGVREHGREGDGRFEGGRVGGRRERQLSNTRMSALVPVSSAVVILTLTTSSFAVICVYFFGSQDVYNFGTCLLVLDLVFVHLAWQLTSSRRCTG